MTTEFDTYSNREFSLLDVANFNRQAIPDQIAIEGNVGSGKSTVATLFGQLYSLPHIGEYGNYVNFVGGEKFPTFPPTSELDVVTSNPLWLKLEFRRQSHMIESTKRNPNELLLVERSPLSLIAFEYAKMKQGLPFEVSNLAGNYMMFMDVGLIKEPSGYVFLNTTSTTVEKRIIARGGRSIDFLFNPLTCAQIEEFFAFFKINYLERDSYIDIQTDKKIPEVIVKEVKTFLDSIDQKNKIGAGAFSRFCSDILTENIVFEQI